MVLKTHVIEDPLNQLIHSASNSFLVLKTYVIKDPLNLLEPILGLGQIRRATKQ